MDNKTAASATSTPSMRRPFYADYAERLQSKSPRLFAVARLTRRALAAMWRRRFLVAPAALLLGSMFVAGLTLPDLENRFLLSGAALFLGILLLLLYLAWWTYHRIRALALETAALRTALSRKVNEERAKRTKMELKLQKERDDLARRLDTSVRQECRRLGHRIVDHDSRLSSLDRDMAHLASQTDNVLSKLDAQLQTNVALEEIIAEIDEGLSSLESDLDAAQREEAQSKERIEELQQQIKEQADVIRTVTDERTSLRKQVSEQADTIGTVTDERASLREQVGDLERRAQSIADQLEERAQLLETVMGDRNNSQSDEDPLNAQCSRLDEYKKRLDELSRADQKKKISENNYHALQEKYKKLVKHNDAQAARLKEIYAHVKAARERVKALGEKD